MMSEALLLSALRRIRSLAMETSGDDLAMSDALAAIEREARNALDRQGEGAEDDD